MATCLLFTLITCFRVTPYTCALIHFPDYCEKWLLQFSALPPSTERPLPYTFLTEILFEVVFLIRYSVYIYISFNNPDDCWWVYQIVKLVLMQSSLNMFTFLLFQNTPVFKKRPNFLNSSPTSTEGALRLLSALSGRF